MLKVHGTKVLVKLDEVETKKGSIFIPDSAQDVPFTGTVTAIGCDVKSFFVDMKVIIGRFSGTEIKREDGTYVVVDEEYILAEEA